MPKKKPWRKSGSQQKIAKERIYQLFEQAQKRKDEASLAKRYVTLARTLSEKFKVPMPRELRRRFCRNCNAYFIPEKNCRVRLNKPVITYTCLECKHQRRFRYK